LVGGAACAVNRTGIAAGGDPMVLTSEQIARSSAANAYELVERTHGDFLHSRGRESSDPNVPAIPAHVYVDDTYYGDVSTLRGIPVGDIEEIRFWESYQAQLKFGSGHMGGVIQVITKH
jgi:hypothetical protein